MSRRFILFLAMIWLVFVSVSFAEIPSPESSLGFQVGSDYRLARWEQIVAYFYQVSAQSDRVIVEEIGRTTENSPYIIATISSPETIQRRYKYQTLQRKLSHPNEILYGEKEGLLNQAKNVILVACSLHSNEIAASQMAMELLYELATRNDERIREILENTIILLVPSANPDGINKVIDWYDRSLGTPWEGTGMPWLYQKYVGHDDNRDWFMLTQKESQILTRVLYRQWYPCLIYDIHQMGNNGCRFFVPPFYDPINPNVDPMIHESLKLIGGAMATDFASEGKPGIITNAIYDNWWHGGNRTTPYRHNIVGVLTEAASPRVASPVFQEESELTGHKRGLPEYTPQVNFADPWPGGWWRLRDVVEYEKTACYSLFTLAARYRDLFNRNYLAMGEKALRLGGEEPPFAYLISPNQRDFPTAIRMLKILHQGGVTIEIADQSFTAENVEYPVGTYIIRSAQPYRNHIRDLLDPQDYPERKQYPGGPAEVPYDIAGWTLSYQMGVSVVRVPKAFSFESHPLDTIELPRGRETGSGSLLISSNQTTNDFILLNRALKESIPVSVLYRKSEKNTISHPVGSLQYSPSNQNERSLMEKWIEELGLVVKKESSRFDSNDAKTVKRPRIALYQPWTANMDEGWTRWVLEQFEFDYKTLHNAEIQAGDLHQRYDVILIPDMGTAEIMQGKKVNTTAPDYVGGIEEEGVAQLQEFVADGGRLLCLDNSTAFAIQYFDLPVHNVLQGLKSNDFFCPGSILRIHMNPDHPLTYGMNHFAGASFNRSCAFEFDENQTYSSGIPLGQPSIAAVYDSTLTLMSGWILGEKYLQNKSAILTVPYGNGEIVLYGFRVQHRAQPHGTFRLLFNGLVFGGKT